MKNFADEKKQFENINNFKKLLNNNYLNLALFSISLLLNQNIENTKEIKINNKKIADSDVYKTHFPIFKEISEKTFDKFDLLSAFGFTNDDILELKKDAPNKNKISNILLNNLGINISTKNEIEFLKIISNKVTPKINKKMIECMYFSNDELNKILNGIDDYLQIDKKNKSNKDKKLREYLSLKLYADAFEIYLKILNELYSKFEKINIKKIDNTRMYDFFNNNYPILLESTNNKLRNDVCHLNYTERGNYTLDQIDDERNIIIIKIHTALIAKNVFILDFFDNSIDIENRSDAFFDEFLKFFDSFT